MTRTGACDVCGDEITVTTTRGPIPRYCPACRGVARQPALGLMHGRLAVSCWCEATVVYVPQDDVYAGDEVLLLRDQLQAKADHGTPLVAPDVEPVVAGLAAHFPRVD